MSLTSPARVSQPRRSRDPRRGIERRPLSHTAEALTTVGGKDWHAVADDCTVVIVTQHRIDVDDKRDYLVPDHLDNREARHALIALYRNGLGQVGATPPRRSIT